MMGLKSYPAYKNSRAEWMGKVPNNWHVSAIKRFYQIRLGKMLQPQQRTPDDCEVPYLKAKHVQWFDVRMNDADTMWANQNEIDRYEVLTGDLLVCEGGEGGRCGIVAPSGDDPNPCIIQNALHRVRPRALANGTRISRNDYLQYVMSAIAAAGWFDSLNDKATIAHFTAEKFGALLAPVPPLPEQTAIVRFLDYADRRIRHYIRAKQKLIALLEEQKQAIIHQAVTGQIDVRTGQPYPAYKNSGVEWLGEVPEHWEISRVKTEFHCLNHRRLPVSGTERGEMSFRRYDYYGASGVIDKVDDYLFDDELLLIAEDGANLVLRNLPLAIIARGKFWVNNHAHILKPKRGRIEFLASVMESLSYLPWISGAAQPKLTKDRLTSIAIAVPSREEQNRIVSFSGTKTSPLRIGISRAEREINLLREYRTRLIADVVTGKLDVREAAAKLPEIDPLADASDVDGTPDTEVESDIDEFNSALEEAKA